MLTIAETSRLLRVTPLTIKRWIKSGSGKKVLKSHKVGGRRLIAPKDLNQFVGFELVKEARR